MGSYLELSALTPEQTAQRGAVIHTSFATAASRGIGDNGGPSLEPEQDPFRMEALKSMVHQIGYVPTQKQIRVDAVPNGFGSDDMTISTSGNYVDKKGVHFGSTHEQKLTF